MAKMKKQNQKVRIADLQSAGSQKVEPQKQADPPKKIDPPKIEGGAPAKLWTDEHREKQWVLDTERCLQCHPFKAVTGVKDLELGTHVITSALKAIAPIVGEEIATNVIIQSLHDFHPKDAIEARLVVQAAVAHTYAMKSVKQSGDTDMLCHIEAMMNMGIKLMRVHNETIEALSRYRRGGEQRVVIQHQQVNVSGQGQAVVGQFHAEGGGD